jgi:hypothetical protein
MPQVKTLESQRVFSFSAPTAVSVMLMGFFNA